LEEIEHEFKKGLPDEALLELHAGGKGPGESPPITGRLKTCAKGCAVFGKKKSPKNGEA